MGLKYLHIACGMLCLAIGAKAQVRVDINLDLKHQVGQIDQFDRNKFVAIHANTTEREWDGDNFTTDLRNDFLNGYDVYLGRDTGGISWALNSNTDEDPARPGFADPAGIESYGTTVKNNYAAQTSWHPYEDRNDQILAAQLHPFWPDGQETNRGWAFSEADTEAEPFGTATGEYMGRYIRDSYGTGGTTGAKKPLYVEVINEPLWHLVDFGTDEPEKIFRFHNAVADQIRKYNDDVLIGGFCTAFPDHENRGFAQWNERWKLFMDMSGDKMDYWTIHLYDFPSINNGKQRYRKGSNMEATFDLMEQYSYMQFGEVKPFMISEYGAQMHDYFGAWSPYRDWLHLKSVNSMMMQFMERANIINKTLNFLPVKAEWGTNGVDDTYNHRLMRKADEPQAYTGEWVYSDMVKTYQLWSEVKGTRVDSYATSLDLLVDAYVDGKTAYVILNNLKFEAVQIELNALGLSTAVVEETDLKHLYLEGQVPVLEQSNQQGLPEAVSLESEATMILKLTLNEAPSIDQTSVETKYYATDYLQEIHANEPLTFTISGVQLGDHGEAMLRLGLGRAHGKSLVPTVLVNGFALDVPVDFRGDDQADRDSFFGVIEIPVPYQQLQNSNEVKVTFADEGGHLSSVAMQVYGFSREVDRSNPVLGLEDKIASTSLQMKVYPNPSFDSVRLEVAPDFVGGQWQIMTLSGQVAQEAKIDQEVMLVDASVLPSGVYLIRVSNQGEVLTRKLVLK
ncbi:agarase [Reichenbachiella agariperforans]|uniref:Agarase n=1 Tax=Reichenbachiella agariperforans TaxID=156994 RepID=A0A1M6UJX9_REIAG|nr:T9SS type A sorting domain-containing protein [Reichenbachiella agariperforans]SHK69418.1 agarase [Reichenbachiella agariperforans]